MFNLRGVDLNLLPVFEAVYETGSLTRAAERLAMTPPAVSHALSRLRATFEDALFVRQSRGVAPTPAAERIYGHLHGALASVRDAVLDARRFDPATSPRSFFVAIAHPLGPLIAVELRRRLARAAPRLSVDFSTRSRPLDVARDLRDGRVDVALDWLAPPGAEWSEAPAFDDGLLAMVRPGHPLLRVRDARRLMQAAEFVTLRRRAERPHPSLEAWFALGLKITLEVSEFVEVMFVAQGSDMVGSIPFSMERMARDFFGLRPLRALPRTAALPIRLVWHRRRDGDAAHAYLRDALRASARAVVSARAGG